ncbi:MAG: hypothetical protein LBG60_04845 [Bifidobacteriaceae bacterium]|nr:hypothetical protein [Bifidobacteriaceae bacterium]
MSAGPSSASGTTCHWRALCRHPSNDAADVNPADTGQVASATTPAPGADNPSRGGSLAKATPD